MRPLPSILCVLLILLLATTGIITGVPQRINYQGMVTDTENHPVDTTADITIIISSNLNGTDSLWAETHENVVVTNGLFDIVLGSINPIPTGVFDGQQRWLGMQVDGGPLSTPLLPIVSTAYAMRAASADTAAYALASPGGVSSGWVDDGSVVRLASGGDRVGIGTSTPQENLVVGGNLGSFPEANYIVSCNPNFEEHSGLKIGFNADNHATINWYGDGDQLRFDTRFMGTNYNNNLVLRQGLVGIGVSYPQEPLAIGVDLGSYYGDFVQIGRLGTGRYSGFIFGEDQNNRGTMLWYNDSNELRFGGKWNGNDYGATMTLKEGKVGIGTTSPSEPLVVGPDLGSFGGNRIVVGDTTAGSEIGLVFGESSISRGWLLWNSDDNFVSLGIRDAGTYYTNILNLKEGNVNIGGDYVGAKLHVESDYDIALGVTRYGVFNNVISSGAGTTLGLHSHVHQQQNFNLPEHALICALDGYATATNPGCSTSVGVRGEAWGGRTNYGVQALVNTHLNYGIGIFARARASDEYWAGVFDGPVDIPSDTYHSASFTRIDHPLDPENKYLQHATVESDEMLNVYNGNVILDGTGEATVDLPEWFGSLNSDFRYQLTCVGGYAPVYIAQKVQDNRFRIAGGSPGLEVSWQVSGVRNDPYAQLNQFQVEVDKSLEDRGRYRAPSAYGRGENASIYKKHRNARPEKERIER